MLPKKPLQTLLKNKKTNNKKPKMDTKELIKKAIKKHDISKRYGRFYLRMLFKWIKN